MLIRLERYWSDEDCTLGKLYVDGKFFCYTLEDEYRKIKVKGETRIPAGTYKVALRYSPKFSPRTKHDMLWIQNVPGFSFILIHPGNSDDDTEGCILVGSVADQKDRKIFNSRDAYKKLYFFVSTEAKNNNLTIEIIDKDNPKGEV